MTRKYLGRLLIVDDDNDFINYLHSGLSAEGFTCDVATDLIQMRKQINYFSYDGILLDIFLGDKNSLKHIPDIVRMQPYAKVLIITANASIKSAVEAMGSGAADFIEKSDTESNIIDRLIVSLKKSQDTKIQKGHSVHTDIIGESDVTTDIVNRIEKLKNVDSSVLILGESGSGKELIARELHHHSTRKDKPFEAINCGAIPEALIESELFGHTKGAFTDAKSSKKGLFEICSEGTLFLDEIGDMPLQMQVKLLRVLQEKEVRPIGATNSISVKTRVIAATNRDLVKEVEKKNFREDLYYRLSVFVITSPPLRSRKNDIPDLILFFLDKYNKQYCRHISPPNHSIMSRLKAYDWPGNVRELKHAIERAVVLSSENELDLREVIGTRQQSSTHPADTATAYSEAKELFEKNYLQRILNLAGGNVSEAARISGRFRSDIYRMMKRYNIKSPS